MPHKSQQSIRPCQSRIIQQCMCSLLVLLSSVESPLYAHRDQGGRFMPLECAFHLVGHASR